MRRAALALFLFTLACTHAPEPDPAPEPEVAATPYKLTFGVFSEVEPLPFEVTENTDTGITRGRVEFTDVRIFSKGRWSLPPAYFGRLRYPRARPSPPM